MRRQVFAEIVWMFMSVATAKEKVTSAFTQANSFRFPGPIANSMGCHRR